MPSATKYVDGAVGNDANSGNSPGAGNAYATIGAAYAGITGGGNLIYVKASATYTLTSAVTCVAGDTTNGPNVIEGYTTTPGARDGRPTITCATNSVNLFNVSGFNYNNFIHLNMTHTAATRGTGIAASSGNSNFGRVDDCLFSGFTYAVAGTGGWSVDNWFLLSSRFSSSTSDGVRIVNPTADGCIFDANGGIGLATGGNFGTMRVRRSIFYNNTGRGADQQTNFGLSGIDFSDCLFHTNGSDGLRCVEATSGTAARFRVRNCIFWGNAAYGANLSATGAVLAIGVQVNRCNAYGSNTSGARLNLPVGIGDVTLTADPCTNAAGGDFSLNNTAGGGAACRAAGFPGVFPGALTTGYLDIGAVQHQDSGGGSSGTPAYAYIG